MSAITCNVEKLEQVNDHVFIVELKSEQAFSYKAGQYLLVCMGENDKRPFSIASAPHQSHLELHIGATKQNSYAMEVLDRMREQGKIEVEVGHGEAYLKSDSQRPIILLAGGTGFSYVQSIALHLAQIKSQQKVLVYWGGKENQSMYANELMNNWQAQNNNFSYIPVVEHPEQDWQGKTGYVHLAAMEDNADLADYDIYMAGHFDMMKVVRDDFEAKGCSREHLFADAFAYI